MNSSLTSVERPNERHQSLLKKYDIPVEHLSYEYIDECSDVKELERIVTILRSGQEGHYPDLTRAAERQLAKLKPNSVIFTLNPQQVTKKTSLSVDLQRKLDREMDDWSARMRGVEKDLAEGKSITADDGIFQPPVRQINTSQGMSCSELKKRKRITACDYAAWDKYDADTEMNRIDLQEEVYQAEAKRQQKQRHEQERTFKLNKIANKALTTSELEILAEQERIKGNEAYKSRDYLEAIEYYTSSIQISPNIHSYNNRAMCYNKLKRYHEAIMDCSYVIHEDFSNEKALFRRASALEQVGDTIQAAADLEMLLQYHPDHQEAQSRLCKLRKRDGTRSVRIFISEEEEVVNTTVATQSDFQPITIGFQTDLRVDEPCYCNKGPGPSRLLNPPAHCRSAYCTEDTENESTINDTIVEYVDNNYISCDDNSAGFIDVSDELVIEELNNSAEKMSLSNNNNDYCCYVNNNNNNATGSCDDALMLNQNVYKEEIGGCGDCKANNSSFTLEKQRDDNEISKPEKEKKIARDADDKNFNFNVNSPYEFLRVWQSLKNEPDLTLHAKLLKTIAPDKFKAVVGNTLDNDMFSLILKTLKCHFCNDDHNEPSEAAALMAKFLEAFTELDRFTILKMFLSDNEKIAISEMLEFLETIACFNSTDLQSLRLKYFH